MWQSNDQNLGNKNTVRYVNKTSDVTLRSVQLYNKSVDSSPVVLGRKFLVVWQKAPLNQG